MSRISTIFISCIVALALHACGESENDSGMIASSMKNLSRDALPGAAITRKECGGCHFLDKNMRKVGPSLKGVFGRAPKTRGIPVEVWDENTLDAWIENPTLVHPETRMKIPGIRDAEKRALIIQYLKEI